MNISTKSKKIAIAAGAVECVTGYSIDDLRNKKRNATLVDARRIFCAMCRLLGASYPDISRALGITHASVMYHVRRHADIMQTDARYRDLTQAVQTINNNDNMLRELTTTYKQNGVKITIAIDDEDFYNESAPYTLAEMFARVIQDSELDAETILSEMHNHLGLHEAPEWNTTATTSSSLLRSSRSTSASESRPTHLSRSRSGESRRNTKTTNDTAKKIRNEIMTLNEYQKQAMTTCMDSCRNIPYMLFNLQGEVGELSSKIAKLIRKERIEPDCIDMVPEAEYMPDIIAECGDVLWQLSGVCAILGVSLETVAQYNLNKLASRQQRGVIEGEGDNR